MGMRQKCRENWEVYPYSLKVEHNGKNWLITFRANDPDPDIDGDVRTEELPGWYKPAKVKKILDKIPANVQKHCTNFDTASRLDVIECVLDLAIAPKILDKIVDTIERVQGKVTCID